MLSPKTQPVRLSAVVVAALQIAIISGSITISQTNLTLLGQSLDVIVPILGPVFVVLVQALGALWTWLRVTPVARAEVLAETLVAVDTARQDGTPVQVPLAARKEAARLLGRPEPESRRPHKVRPL